MRRTRHTIELSLITTMVLAAGILAFVSTAEAQNHPWPRIGTFHFFKGQVPPDWHARMDLVDINKTNPEVPRKIHAINPKTVVFSTSGWTVWNSNNPIWRTNIPFPDEWFARKADGSLITFPGNKHLINLSDLCPRVNGKRYVELLPEILIARVDLTAWDGIASDWLWRKPHGQTDIDLDNDGRNDYQVHNENWVIARWQAGIETLLQILRDLMPPNKYILVNSGLFQEFGWTTTNGLIMENLRGLRGWQGLLKTYLDWSKTSRQPHLMLWDTMPSDRDPNINVESKNYYTHMRFMLTVAMLGDGYFSFSDKEARALHHFDKYYDEYDLNIGFPVSEPQQLPNGCMARFFQKGASITNPTGTPQPVSDSDLRSLSGYSGPYFRFQGGQAPSVNNGQLFNRIDLFGDKLSDGLIVGDGIILVTEKQTVVSDIIIDHQNAETSPGSKPAELIGTWTETNDVSEPYSMRSADHNGLYGVAYAAPGSGQKKAIYKPTITIAGEYDVYEWHGEVTGPQMATNVPYKLVIGSQVKFSSRLDQSNNVGRWNKLGTYKFPAGSNSSIEITNDANGITVADAIKLVYTAGIGESDIVAPAPPTGVKATTGE